MIELSHKHLLFLITSYYACLFTGPNTFNENETIAKYEIMDGAPVRGQYELLYKVVDIEFKQW